MTLPSCVVVDSVRIRGAVPEDSFKLCCVVLITDMVRCSVRSTQYCNTFGQYFSKDTGIESTTRELYLNKLSVRFKFTISSHTRTVQEYSIQTSNPILNISNDLT